MDTNANTTPNKNVNEKTKKQVTFNDFVKPNPKKAPNSDFKKTTDEVTLMESKVADAVPADIVVPVRSDNELPCPSNHGKELHPNLLRLDEHRQSVWKKMDKVVAETEIVYKSRISMVKSVEKKLIDTIQETTKNTIASLDKNREILLETIAQKLQEFESMNKVCEEDINTLNAMQNRLKETLDRVGFNV